MKLYQINESKDNQSKEKLPDGWKLTLQKSAEDKIYTKAFKDNLFGKVELAGTKAICTLFPAHDLHKNPMWSKIIKLTKPEDLIKVMKLLNTVVDRIDAKKEGSK